MPAKRQRLTTKQLWLIVIGLWSSIALFHYVQFYFQHVNGGDAFLWWPTLIEFIANYYSWVLIGFCVVSLGRRFRFQSGNWRQPLLIHTAACVIFGVLHLALVAILLRTFKGFAFKSFSLLDYYVFVFLWLFHFEVLVYWVVLGLSYGFEFYAQTGPKERRPASPNQRASVQLNEWRIPIKNNGDTLLLDTSRVDWMEAADNYVNIHADGRCYLLRERMHVLEQRLDPEHFQRIHRSTIVNMARVKELRRGERGDVKLVLRNGKQLPVSRRRREQVQSFFAAVT